MNRPSRFLKRRHLAGSFDGFRRLVIPLERGQHAALEFKVGQQTVHGTQVRGITEEDLILMVTLSAGANRPEYPGQQCLSNVPAVHAAVRRTSHSSIGEEIG